METGSAGLTRERDAGRRRTAVKHGLPTTISIRVCVKRRQGRCKNQQPTSQCSSSHRDVQNLSVCTRYPLSGTGKAGPTWSCESNRRAVTPETNRLSVHFYHCNMRTLTRNNTTTCQPDCFSNVRKRPCAELWRSRETVGRVPQRRARVT